jgi:hypothetical protein
VGAVTVHTVRCQTQALAAQEPIPQLVDGRRIERHVPHTLGSVAMLLSAKDRLRELEDKQKG